MSNFKGADEATDYASVLKDVTDRGEQVANEPRPIELKGIPITQRDELVLVRSDFGEPVVVCLVILRGALVEDSIDRNGVSYLDISSNLFTLEVDTILRLVTKLNFLAV